MNISNNIKKTISFLSAAAIIITSAAFPVLAEDNKTETVIIPEAIEIYNVSPDDSIQEKLNEAKDNNENEYTKIVLSKGETYCLDLPLYVYSNTIIEAEGAVIERTYNKSDKGTGLIRNRAKDGTAGYDSKIGGYELTKNVYISGGVWSGGEMPDGVVSSTNVIFCHADNINLLNAEFRNVFEGHLVEFNAVSNSLVQNCSFDGLKKSNSGSSFMAFQIDIAHSYETCKRNDGEHINCPDHDSIPEGYYPDNTACKNIRILSNSWGTKQTDFANFDTACGSDKTLTDGAGPLNNPGSPIYHEDINISYNTINGCTGTAIASRGHKNITIKGNSITSCGEKGIIIKRSLGGTVSENTLTDIEDTAILIFEKSTLPSGNAERKVTTLDSITDNTVTRAKGHGIAVQDESIVNKISNNSITDTDGHSISISGNSQIEESINDNTLKSSAKNGIFIYDNSTVNAISNNNISNSSISGIVLSTNSSVTDKISLNTITKPLSYGILETEQSSSGLIENNKISDAGKHGINIYKSTAGTVKGNTISNSKEHGIVLSAGSKTTGNIENNTISKSGKNGIFLYNGSSTAIIRNNKISDSKLNGIAASQNSSISEISNNTISNSSNCAISISSKSKVTKIIGNKFANNTANCKISKDSQVLQNDCIAVKTTSSTVKTVKKPTVKKVKALKVKSKKKKTATVTWKKLSGVNGYVIEYSLKKNLKNAKSKKIGKKVKSYKFKRLKSKKKYFFRMRAYKKYTVNGKTKTAYGPYTSVKKVKIK